MPRIVSLLPWWFALPLLRATLLAQAAVQEPAAAATAAAARAAMQLEQAAVQEPDPAATAAAVRAAMLHKIAGYVAVEEAKDGQQVPPIQQGPQGKVQQGQQIQQGQQVQEGQQVPPPPAPAKYRIGVVGRDATVASAQKTLPGKTVRGTTIEVVTVTIEDAVAGRAAALCDLLYIASSVDDKTAAKIVAKQADKPVALVSAQPGFAAAGGGVQLFVKDGGIRFEINTGALKRQGLHASAQLLKHSQKGPKR